MSGNYNIFVELDNGITGWLSWGGLINFGERRYAIDYSSSQNRYTITFGLCDKGNVFAILLQDLDYHHMDMWLMC